MPYDPNFPAHNAELISAEFRDQFHGLKDLIDAAAAALSSLTPSQIGTLGFPAWDGGGSYGAGDVVAYAGRIYICTSPIPGSAGDPTLLPFSWMAIGSLFQAVATAAQGVAADFMNGAFLGSPIKLPFGWNFLGFEVWDVATAYTAGDALTYAFTLYVAIAAHSGVPPDSNPAIWMPVPTFFDVAGAATAKAADVLAASSNNTNAVALLGLIVSNPPTQAEVQSIADKIDEMITAQRR